MFKVALVSISLLTSQFTLHSEENSRLSIIKTQIAHLQQESKKALDESIANPYNGRAIEYIRHAKDCNDKITDLINNLNQTRK